MHDLEAKRLLFATAGRSHRTLQALAEDLYARGGDPLAIEHACIDMSTAYAKGIGTSLPNAQISYDRFRVVALANAAMDAVRRDEMGSAAAEVRQAVGLQSPRALRQLLWGIRKNPVSWTPQCEAMHWLLRSNLKSARASRLKQALRMVHQEAAASNCEQIAQGALKKWLSWARRSRLEPFKRLAVTLKAHLGGVVRGMLDGRSNAYVEAMNGLLQQTKAAARGFPIIENFIAMPTSVCPSSSIYQRAPWCLPSHANTAAIAMFVLESISTGNGIEPHHVIHKKPHGYAYCIGPSSGACRAV